MIAKSLRRARAAEAGGRALRLCQCRQAAPSSQC